MDYYIVKFKPERTAEIRVTVHAESVAKRLQSQYVPLDMLLDDQPLVLYLENLEFGDVFNVALDGEGSFDFAVPHDWYLVNHEQIKQNKGAVWLYPTAKLGHIRAPELETGMFSMPVYFTAALEIFKRKVKERMLANDYEIRSTEKRVATWTASKQR